MSIVVRIVDNRLPEIARALPKAARDAVEDTIDEMLTFTRVGMAQSGSPSAPGDMPGIDLGILVASLGKEMDGAKPAGDFYAGGDYAPHLEYGTVKMAPRPFMAPAAVHGRRFLIQALSDLERALR